MQARPKEVGTYTARRCRQKQKSKASGQTPRSGIKHPATLVSEKLPFAPAAAGENGALSALILALLAKPQSSVEEAKHEKLAGLVRKYNEQCKAKGTVPSPPTLNPRAAISKREGQHSANYEIILRSLKTLPPGRECEGIRILLD